MASSQYVPWCGVSFKHERHVYHVIQGKLVWEVLCEGAVRKGLAVPLSEQVLSRQNLNEQTVTPNELRSGQDER